MKVITHILENLAEERITIEARALTPPLQELIDQAERLGQPDRLLVKKEGQRYQIALTAIERLVIEDRKVLALTREDTYTVPLRLYQVKELLDSRFLQISQSEIVQVDQIQKLELLPNGLIQLQLKNGQSTFSSRRYLKAIKERLQVGK